MDQYTYEIKIPKERVAVLIGKEGSIKKSIEEDTSTTLKIDSNEGDVFVSGEDALKLYSAREIITAIGRGFNPDIALKLLKSDIIFEIIHIAEYARNKNDEKRLKGRIIGQEGKSRKIIEELSDAHICVYGKTASFIGEAYNVSLAKRAVSSLLNGSTHAKVFKYLERQRVINKTKEFEAKNKG
tara:strand:+ start:175 stop:726 length:552 start_codon:yes stop_codon:yes gene_type:complete